jgi:hypothetical protein
MKLRALKHAFRWFVHLRLRYKLIPLMLVATGLLIGMGTGQLNRSPIVPGNTSDGHHLIDGSCNSCHQPFAGVGNKQCEGCHTEELRDDTHPVTTFSDPRWAEALGRFDSTRCASCHLEHSSKSTVTMPPNTCFDCHDDVASKRASHATLEKSSCATGGCHNFHDNSMLRQAFLTKRLSEPNLLPTRSVLDLAKPRRSPLAAEFPRGVTADAELVARWQASAHATGGVGCGKCHGSDEASFREAANDAQCAECHASQSQTFEAGKHGVRNALALGPLAQEAARLPMKPHASGSLTLGCGTCHDVHSVDTRTAAVNACLSCHDDEHSRAYLASPHAKPQANGEAAATCATCHLPRVDSGGKVAVNHNNAQASRPREHMLEDVCLDCHGLPFALSSLYDPRLIRNNFNGQPSRPHPTLSMVAESNSAKQKRNEQ